MISASVVIPVLDGERYLAEVLAAARAEGPYEILVIDSGSRDRSVEIARAAGVELVEIPQREFGHGRTRNLGCERTRGEIVCFLTQDATPVPGWLAAYRAAFEGEPRIGAAYGPHLPRPSTSPMIARELNEFFAGFSTSGELVVQDADQPFLSNVNAAYRRRCWEEVGFRDVPYAEDQAFGRDLATTTWRKAYAPGAAVLHAHDYGAIGFMRRYFDEYRGLRATTGHVEPFAPHEAARHVRALVRADRRWMAERGVPRRARSRWTARATVHHGGRMVFSALGSRAHHLPATVRRGLSLERRADAVAPPAATHAAGVPGPPLTRAIAPGLARATYDDIARVVHDGPAPLLPPQPGMADRERFHVAFAIPPFTKGSGGHSSIFQLVRGLEARGHTCSIWLDDPLHQQVERAAVSRRSIVEDFVEVRAPVYRGWKDWFGADVLVATGWQTVYPVLAQGDCRARAYLVHDHEPEFYATSVESWYARRTYEYDLFWIAASPWLRDLLANRHGRRGSVFQFGVDRGVYHPQPLPREPATVVFYARWVTPRRAVPLGLLALEALSRRRTDVRIVLFGIDDPPAASFSYDHIGVASPRELAALYSQATVGLCLSMTNYSLVPQEMLACGMPCVDLAGFSGEAVFGDDGPVELADFDPIALADAVERLLDDPDLWHRRSAAGLDFVAGRTWTAAAAEVEEGLRRALREREREAGGVPGVGRSFSAPPPASPTGGRRDSGTAREPPR